MKLVFVGPTVPDARSLYPGLGIRPPARQGDIFRAVEGGATGIGLIDGYFDHVPAVWHKEILYTLSKGVRVAGAASMGALRAAECAAFGMEAHGSIAADYLVGRREDDGDVAQIHGPETLGYLPLSEPLVTVEAVLEALRHTGLLAEAEHDRLLAVARALFFKERTWPRILAEAGYAGSDAYERISNAIENAGCNPKRADALLLLDAMMAWPPVRGMPPDHWTFREVRSFTPLLKPQKD